VIRLVQRLHGLRGRPRSLRARLMSGTVLVAVVGLVAVDVFGLLLLRSYLVGQLDRQLDGPLAGTRPPAGRFRDQPSQQQAQQMRALQQQHEPVRTDVALYRIDPDGSVSRSLPTSDRGDLPDVTRAVESRAGHGPFTLPGRDGSTSWRAVVRADPDGYNVVAVSTGAMDRTLTSLAWIEAGVTLGVLLLVAVLAWWVSRLALRPLSKMQGAVEGITGNDLSSRVPAPDSRTEIGRLGHEFNTMLSRIESAVRARDASESRLRRFVADASHELRTPLTSIRGFAELYRSSTGGHGPDGQLIRRIEDESTRMSRLVDDLLLLAQLDEQRPLDIGPVDLLEVLADVAQDARVRAPDRPLRVEGLTAGSAPPPVTVRADDHRIRQVVTNLVGNALTYTPPDHPVVLRLGRQPYATFPTASTAHAGSGHAGTAHAGSGARMDGGSRVNGTAVTGLGGAGGGEPAAAVGAVPMGPAAVIEVADAGPGIEPERAALMFERFWRSDPARTRTHGGAGLGLAIVAAIVTAHGGRVELRTAPGEGCRFRVLLPLAAAAAVPL
jgi:two-component system OmpR family sensor kinase